MTEYPAERDKAQESTGLKHDAIGFVNNLVFGLASVAPAFSIAAVIGLVTVAVGVQAPAVLLASFVPMFLVAAFYYMNRADQDCGTTFAWATRAMGPWLGWLGGWAMGISLVFVVGSLADVAARYTFLFFGLEAAAASTVAVTVLAVLFMVAMTAIAVSGVEPSARFQNILIVMQVGALLLFAVVALVQVYTGNAQATSVRPEASWFSPFAVPDGGALIAGLLIAVFIYWGWEVTLTLNEETEHSSTAPGLAAVVSTVILLITYVSVTTAVVAFGGPETVNNFADDDAILSTLAAGVLGSTWGKLVVLAVMTSGLASSQTVIVSASRTVLSMGRSGALPFKLGEVHPRFRTPHVATIAIGVLATVWYVPLNLFSQNFLFDTLSALTLLIAFYYAIVGFSCVIYYRKETFKSIKNFLFVGLAPLLGAVALTFLLFRAIPGLADPDASYTGSSLFGLGLPFVIGVGTFLLGVVLMLVWRFAGGHERFFRRGAFESADPKALTNETQAADELATSLAEED